MNQIHLNGIALIPGIDYTCSNATVMFSIPPPCGADIVLTEVVNVNSGATYQTRLVGNGKQYLFKLGQDSHLRAQISDLFEKAVTHRDHPAVKEALDRLRVVIELIDG